MRAGRLRHRITIEKKESTRDALGGESITWSKVGTVWGGIEPLSGRELESAQQIHAETTTRVVMRFCESLTANHRISHNGLIYDVVSVVNHDLRNRQLTVMCKSGVNQDGR